MRKCLGDGPETSVADKERQEPLSGPANRLDCPLA